MVEAVEALAYQAVIGLALGWPSCWHLLSRHLLHGHLGRPLIRRCVEVLAARRRAAAR